MTDRDFFYKTLGLSEPWEVKDVRLDLGGRRVELEIGVKAGTAWGQDGLMLPIEGYEERTWRHLDTMQLETVLRARVPRVRYPDGHTEMVSVPWATPRSRWTVAFEALAIRVMQACGSINEASKLLRIDWRAAQRIMERAVQRGLERREVERVERLGIDEKSFRKGHRYGTLLADLDEGRVLEVVEERTTQAAGAALASLGASVLQGVEAVAMDMSAAYAAAVREHCPQADIVYDKFHVSALLGQAVDRTRRQEHARLKAQGDQILKSTRYDWLYDPGHMSEDRFLNFQELVARDLKTARAWHHRVLFGEFWNHSDPQQAQAFFQRWYARAIRSRLPFVVRAAQTLKAHLQGLLNYLTHRITNAMSEAFNSRIQSLKSAARGFHLFSRFRTRILFFLGSLDLQPR